ncbi:hypothetical protein, partial [Microcoleus sp. CAWBG52]|uniref:hypothetical protein n=1 Tax=Microcoleus sp. CAWBG52 TaxID=2841649 RepID=UPI0025F4D0F9
MASVVTTGPDSLRVDVELHNAGELGPKTSPQIANEGSSATDKLNSVFNSVTLSLLPSLRPLRSLRLNK